MFYITFIGRLTKDATSRTFENSNVLNFNVAVNFLTGKKDAQGNYENDVLYLPCTKWNSKNLEKDLQNLKLGTRVVIQGYKLELNSHTDPTTGKEYQNLNVLVQSYEILDYEKKEVPLQVQPQFQQQMPQVQPQQAFYPPQGQPQQQQAQGFFARMNEEQIAMQAQAFEQIPPEVRHTYQQAPQGLKDVDLSY